MRLAFIAFAFSAALFSATAAQAGKNDDAWARCIWEQVPTSAANWLKMPAPKSDYGLAAVPPEYALQFRLQAACFDRLTPSGKSHPPDFNAKAVRSALATLQPMAVEPDKIDPKAWRCTRYFENDTAMKTPAGYDWGYGDDMSKARFYSITYFFAGTKGGTPVGLPTTGGLRKCQFILADGTFKDA
jgi:hypothetical protein